jgi:hypothetical protein
MTLPEQKVKKVRTYDKTRVLCPVCMRMYIKKRRTEHIHITKHTEAYVGYMRGLHSMVENEPRY